MPYSIANKMQEFTNTFFSVKFYLIFVKHFSYTFNEQICGLYYKTITIVIMTIVSDATIWSVTYDRN